MINSWPEIETDCLLSVFLDETDVCNPLFCGLFYLFLMNFRTLQCLVLRERNTCYVLCNGRLLVPENYIITMLYVFCWDFFVFFSKIGPKEKQNTKSGHTTKSWDEKWFWNKNACYRLIFGINFRFMIPDFCSSYYQRWSPRGRPWPRGRPRGHILKSLALALASKVKSLALAFRGLKSSKIGLSSARGQHDFLEC